MVEVSKDETAELRVLITKATNEMLADGGRYFAESCDDLTRCRHEEIGEYQNSADGELIEWLWNRRYTFATLQAERDRYRVLVNEAFEFLGGVDGAIEIRARLMSALSDTPTVQS